MDKRAFAIVILVGIVAWLFGTLHARNQTQPSPGRFVRLGNGSVWAHDIQQAQGLNQFWTSLSMTESTLAFDTATGQVCRTNTYPRLFDGDAGLPDMQEGTDGKPEPVIDPSTNQPRRRHLPVCAELSKE